jgi:hypothetical protein
VGAQHAAQQQQDGLEDAVVRQRPLVHRVRAIQGDAVEM